MAEDILNFDATDDTGQNLHFSINFFFAGSANSGSVTAISGSVGSYTITGLDGSYQGPDNTISTTAPYVDYAGLSFDLSDGGLYNLYNLGALTIISDSGQYSYKNGQASNVSFQAVCFAQGSMIATESGQRAVEALSPGDLVRTHSGALRPVKWVGHRKVNALRAANLENVLPVRVAAHAFGDNRPARDLYLSPGHAVCVDMLGEALMPISSLLNGATIAQVDAATIVYWHVELDSHDILLAENLPTESYLDSGNRGFFVEAESVELDAKPDAVERALAEFCRPFHEKGPLVEAARLQLAARARALGWRLERRPDYHLLTDAGKVAAQVEGRVLSFPAPRDGGWLVAEASRPCDVQDSLDKRTLGVSIASLTVEYADAPPVTIPLDDPRLAIGFYDVEERGLRWTKRRAWLAPELFGEGAKTVRIALAGQTPPRWVAPLATAEAQAA